MGPGQEAEHKRIRRRKWRRFLLLAISPFIVAVTLILILGLWPGLQFKWKPVRGFAALRGQEEGVGVKIDRFALGSPFFDLTWTLYSGKRFQELSGLPPGFDHESHRLGRGWQEHLQGRREQNGFDLWVWVGLSR